MNNRGSQVKNSILMEFVSSTEKRRLFRLSNPLSSILFYPLSSLFLPWRSLSCTRRRKPLLKSTKTRPLPISRKIWRKLVFLAPPKGADPIYELVRLAPERQALKIEVPNKDPIRLDKDDRLLSSYSLSENNILFYSIFIRPLSWTWLDSLILCTSDQNAWFGSSDRL